MTAYRELRQGLAKAYPNPGDWRTAATDLGLDWTTIELLGASGTVWSNILTAIRERGRMDKLRAFIASEEPQLLALFDGYAGEIAAGQFADDAAPDALHPFATRWQREADATLQNAFIDFSAYIADKTRDFVGRRMVFDALDVFLKEAASGYFVVRGDPGIGKSAIMAQIVKDHGYPHHFNIVAEGITTASQFYLNAISQLIACHGLEHVSLPVEARRDANFFKRVLGEAAKVARPVVLVIDALDELSEPALDARANPLMLPALLPDGVYIVASTRRTDEVLELHVERSKVIELRADAASNTRDIALYIGDFARRPAMTARLQELGLAEADFTVTLQEKSEGNFMYLRYVLPAIEEGRIGADKIDQLPTGLLGYYQSHWDKMRGRDAATFVKVNQKIIAVLATAHRPITLRFIARVAKLPAAQVQWTLSEWREFLHESTGGEAPTYRLYHASYRDFLAEQVAG
jgi:hypothetical protein